MKKVYAVLSAGAFFSATVVRGQATATDPARPSVYSPVAEDDTEQDKQLEKALKEAYQQKYRVVEIRDSEGYVHPKLKSGNLPRFALADSGEALSGDVMIAYIITREGRATEPVVLSTTDERLNKTAINALDGWRFVSSKVKGKKTASIAAQEFHFSAKDAPVGFAAHSIVLYQPDKVMKKRVTSAKALAEYIKRLEAICSEFFSTDRVPENLHIVVAVRASRQARVWFVSSKRSAGTNDLEPLRKQLEAVSPVEVQGGPVAFAIAAKIAGGEDTAAPTRKDFQPPIPQEWQDAARNQKSPVAVPDGFLYLVWPEGK